MKLKNLLAVTALALGANGCLMTPDYARPLPPGAPALLPLDPGEARPDFRGEYYARDEILPALERSIAWLERDYSQQFFPMEGVSHERALASLLRLREILLESRDAEEFDRLIGLEFTVYKSAGWDGRGGGVLFTGYCTPILPGRLEPDAEHRWPLYALPDDLAKGPGGEILGQRLPGGTTRPYPTRRAIEAGALLDGQGLELVWMSDPVDAYIAHVNGSAFVELEDGEMLRLGYSGKNGRDYSSLGAHLVDAGVMNKDEVSLAAIRSWGREHRAQVEEFLHMNDSYVFFTTIDGNPRGSLNLEVEPERTLATDKSIFPRAGVVYVDTKYGGGEGARMHQFMFDQDTGGAIRTAGRADLYLGIGPQAERVAGSTRTEGQLYYLFLAEERVTN